MAITSGRGYFRQICQVYRRIKRKNERWRSCIQKLDTSGKESRYLAEHRQQDRCSLDALLLLKGFLCAAGIKRQREWPILDHQSQKTRTSSGPWSFTMEIHRLQLQIVAHRGRRAGIVVGFLLDQEGTRNIHQSSCSSHLSLHSIAFRTIMDNLFVDLAMEVRTIGQRLAAWAPQRGGRFAPAELTLS